MGLLESFAATDGFWAVGGASGCLGGLGRRVQGFGFEPQIELLVP